MYSNTSMGSQVQTGEGTRANDALLARLREVSLFASLADQELRCMTDAAEIHVAPGEYVARQGEQAKFFWILLTGEMRIVQRQPDGGEQTLAKIPAGSAFGELPLLANIPNAAD